MSNIRYVAVAAVLVISACGGDDPTLAAPEATPEVVTSGENATDAVPETAPDMLAADLDEAPAATVQPAAETVTAVERIDLAVDMLASEYSYAFQVTILISTGGQTAETALVGWVQGDDRQLILRADSGEVVTNVIDGVATVTRDGQTVEVPLGQASEAPSLDVLRGLSDVAEAAFGSLVADLSAFELAELGFEVNGSAGVVVTLAADGSLTSYALAAADGTWSVTTNFSDVGGTFSVD